MQREFKYVADAFYVDTQSIERNPIFLHVGTFTGKTETKLTSMFPTCKIYAIEPHPDNYTRLVQNTRHLSNVIHVNKAITVDEYSDFTILSGTGSCATTYRVNDGIKVPSTTLKKFIFDNSIENIDCVFYNAEGSEMEFLPYLIKSGLQKNVKQLCLNFHVHVPEFMITYQKVDDLLKSCGITDHYHVNDDRITRIASQATGGPTSEKYPCFLFMRKDEK